MDTFSKIKALKRVPLFSSLTESDLSIMAAISVQEAYQKEQVIFSEGDSGGTLFILVSGAIKITVVSSGDEEVVLNTLCSNDYFGEISLLDGQPRSATATTVEDTEVLAIHRDDFLRLIKKKPEFVLTIMATLTLVVRNLTEKVK